MKMPLSNRKVIVAIDDSENAEYAFDCEYFYLFIYLFMSITYFLYLFLLCLISILSSISAELTYNNIHQR